ncbi:30S ribosomal protein S8 [bacterium]|jgi:small subunit ribosomal protein S8|nr:30S ribosomal protein S8 [bacterium]
MNTDPIADLLTRIRNAEKAQKGVVVLPYSRIKFDICKILESQKSISKVQKNDEAKAEITIELDLNKGFNLTLKRISKPGQRIYKKYNELKPVKSGLGFDIISTSKGLMTQKKAYHDKLGGELICRIY